MSTIVKFTFNAVVTLSVLGIGYILGVSAGENDATQRVTAARDAQAEYVARNMRALGMCDYPLAMQEHYGCNYTIVAKNKETRQ